MGIFSKSKREPSVKPTVTLNGRPIITPEEVGTPSRRMRLFGESVRRLSSHPLAQPPAKGVPIGDGAGMEELVALIRPIFTYDASLIRWVANRGGLAFLNAQYLEVDPTEDSAAFSGWMELLRIMGIDLQPDAEGLMSPAAYQAEDLGPMDDQTKENVVGLFVSLDERLKEYPRFESMSITELNGDALFTISKNVGLDYIAWSAVVALRDEVAENLCALPEPSGFVGPGWYTDPVFAKSERYWDGDWTERCREAGRSDEMAIPLA